jgi:hypothetical protein
VVRRLSFAACLAALVGIGTAVPAAAAPLPAFEHVVVVVFENHDANAILGSRDAPTFNALAKR